MPDHRKLRVWHRAHALLIFIVRATGECPRESSWLVNQLRRASASIGANIAEGAGQQTNAQFGRFLAIAMASASEVLNHAAAAKDLGYITREAAEHIEREADALRAMMIVLVRRIREREAHQLSER